MRFMFPRKHSNVLGIYKKYYPASCYFTHRVLYLLLFLIYSFPVAFMELRHLVTQHVPPQS